MTRVSRIVPILASLVGAASAMGVAAGPQRPVFRANANGVLVDVVVTNGRSSVANLKAADFQLLDNGAAQTISDVDYGRLPIDVRIVCDASGSLSANQLTLYSRAMDQLGAALKPDDRVEISVFARHAADVAALGPPSSKITISRQLLDGTAFYDAVALAMITTPRPGRRQLTIVLSDGQDTSSFFDLPALLRAAQRTDAMVYTILAPVMFGSTPSGAVAGLDALAKSTGGRLISLPSSGELGGSFLKTVDEFRQSYVLRYAPEGVAAPGWHTLTVSVIGRNYTIRARQGYEGSQ